MLPTRKTPNIQTEKEPMKKTPEPIIENIFAKHIYSESELLEVSADLGRVCKGINTLEGEKSAVSKDFASRIETQEIKRDGLIENLNNRYVMRETDCIVTLDPKNRSKDYHKQNPDGTPGDFVERREMTQADFQLALPETEGTEP
jgi:hypothetical protein